MTRLEAFDSYEKLQNLTYSELKIGGKLHLCTIELAMFELR